jgi:hypothetical protein
VGGKEGKIRTVDRAAFEPTELRLHFVFSPLLEIRVFAGFPHVQSIRLSRLFQPRVPNTVDSGTGLNHKLGDRKQRIFSSAGGG